MQAGQTGYGTNGRQNFLFPLEVMWLTQGYYQYTYSHDHTYAMDFQGAGFNSQGNVVRVYQCPVYAPFDCHCVARYGRNAPAIVWTSDDKVNFIDGTVDYCTIQFTHENNSLDRHHVGDTVSQGQVISHTGTMGTSGDHVHIEAKKGTYSGFTYYSSGGTSGLPAYRLTGSSKLDNLVGVNDTYIYKGYYDNHNNQRITYNWRSFAHNDPGPGPTPPGPTPGPGGQWPKPGPFPWVLYANKLRNKSSK